MQRLIDQHPLRRGAHPSRDDGMCAMEMVAWLAGEEHSDEPACACPVLAALVRACNDAMTDHSRNRFLRPLVPLLVNSRGSAADERQRGMVALDGLVRELLPRWLERHHRRGEALMLRQLPALRGLEDVRSAHRAVETFVTGQRAVLWVLDRALDGVPAPRFVAGLVQVARALNDAETWTAVVRLIERMAAASGADERFAATAPVR